MKNVVRIFGILTFLAGLTLLFGCGKSGPAGSAGAVGNPGTPGVPGQDATPVTVVNFCGGPSVYPSTFPEYGLVISGKVYGVYSQNGGFLAYLPPGTYVSNAIGSACNFVINADGTVSR